MNYCLKNLKSFLNALNMKFSFGGTGRYFYAKLSDLIKAVSDVPDADAALG